jgi:hypothetical protein
MAGLPGRFEGTGEPVAHRAGHPARIVMTWGNITRGEVAGRGCG